MASWAGQAGLFEPPQAQRSESPLSVGGVSGVARNGLGSAEWGQVMESCNWLVSCSLRPSGATVHS